MRHASTSTSASIPQCLSTAGHPPAVLRHRGGPDYWYLASLLFLQTRRPLVEALCLASWAVELSVS